MKLFIRSLPAFFRPAGKLLPVLLLLSNAPALASSGSNDVIQNHTSDSRIDSIVVTASRLPGLLSQQTSTISRISERELQLLSAVHAHEAMNRIPGVWVSRGNGQEHLTAIRSPVLTGAGSCGAFMVAEQGVPVRATGFCNVNALFDLNTEQAERIEVLRGPGNALHGAGAMHGIINIIAPTPSPIAASAVKLELGPHDYQRLLYTHSDTVDRHGFSLNLNTTHDGGYKQASGFDQQKLSLKHVYEHDKLNIDTLISATNLNQETAGYVEAVNGYRDPALQRSNPFPEAFRDTQSLRWQSTFEQRLDDTTVRITPYARHAEMRFLMHFLPGQPVEDNGQRSIGVQTARIQPLSPQITLTQGFDAEFTEAWLKQSQAEDNPTAPAGKQYDYRVDAQNYAGFLQAELAATQATTLSAGARLELTRYDYDNQLLDGATQADGSDCINGFSGLPAPCRYTRPGDRRDDFENWSLNLASLTQHNDFVSSVFRVSKGFRPPETSELYRLQAGQTVADIESEAISSLEATLRANLPTLGVELTAYYMEKTDVIFQSSDRLNIDNGRTEHYGIEYDLVWQLSDSVSINLAGTFNRQRYLTDVSTPGPATTAVIATKGNDIDTAPRRISSLRLEWQPNEAISSELEWLSMGDYYTDINNEFRYPGHNLLQWRMSYQYTAALELGLRIHNLTNKRYADRADYASFGGERYFIGEPRSIFASAQYRF